MKQRSDAHNIEVIKKVSIVLIVLNLVTVIAAFVFELAFTVIDYFAFPVSSLIYEFIGYPDVLEVLLGVFIVFIPSLLFLLVFVLLKK